MALPRTGNLTSGITPPSSGVVSAPEGAVRKIREVSPAPVASSSTISLQSVDGSSALKKEVSSKAFPLHPQFQEQLHKIQLESELRVMVAESKVEFLTEILSDMKLMDHQVGQLLQRILTKYPDTRNEVMMIKKLMNEFVSKKRK